MSRTSLSAPAATASATTSVSATTKATSRRIKAALAALRQTANVSEAARQAGVARMTLYRWRDADPDFATAWDDAVEAAVDALEAVAWERATQGVTRPVVRNGVVVAETRQYSDAMMMFLLRSLRPDRYDRRAPGIGADAPEGPLTVELVRFAEAPARADTAEPGPETSLDRRCPNDTDVHATARDHGTRDGDGDRHAASTSEADAPSRAVTREIDSGRYPQEPDGPCRSQTGRADAPCFTTAPRQLFLDEAPGSNDQVSLDDGWPDDSWAGGD